MMEKMSTLPWVGNYSGTKRTLAWEPAGQRVPKLCKNTGAPFLETASVFRGGDGGRADGFLVDTEGERRAWDSEGQSRAWDSEKRVVDFQGTVLGPRESSSHSVNSMPLHGPFAFDNWLVQNRSILDGKRVLVLKSGMGALAIFLRKALGVDVTTSDSDDKENEHNCRINSLTVLPHIQHTWGDPFPVSRPDWDIIIASDIEPYAEQSANLVKTLSFLLREYKPQGQRAGCTTITNKSGTQVPVRFPMSLISWRQRVDPSVLFLGCEKEGLEVQHLGHLVYLIQKK